MKCNSCGANLNSGVKFCNNCGAPQIIPGQQQTNNNKNHSSRHIKWIIPVLIIAALAIFLLKDEIMTTSNPTTPSVSTSNNHQKSLQTKANTENNQSSLSDNANLVKKKSDVYYEDFTKSISSNWDTNTRGIKLLRDDKLGIALGGFDPWTHGPLMPFDESAFPLGSHYTIESDIMLKGEDEDEVGFSFSYRSVRGESNYGNIYLTGNKTHLLISDLSLSHLNHEVSYNTGEFAHLSVEVDGDLLIVSLNGQNVMESSSASWDKIGQDEHFHPGMSIFGAGYIKNIKIERLD